MKNYREVKIGPYSAYAIAKKNGFEGAEEEWLESLKPPAVDKTLTEEGQAADAKVTGDALATKAVIDDAAVGTDAWSSKRIIDTLCPPLEETGNPVVCYPVAGYPLGCKVSWEPTQEGTGDPSPENVRPIKGRDSVTVERCGENLLDSMPELPIRIYKNSPSVVVRDGTLPAGQYTMDVRLDVIPGGEALGAALIKYDLADGTEKYFVPRAQNETSTTTTFETAIKKIAVVNYGNIDGNITGISLVPGAAAGDFERYTGQTSTLTMPHTIYGGTVDAVTGESSRTWRTITLTGEESAHIYSIFFYLDLSEDSSFVIEKPADGKTGKSSHYPYAVYTNNCIGFTADGESLTYASNGKYPLSDEGLQQWKSYLAAQYAAGTPVQACYKLTEPVPFTATGAQPVPALSGVNTVITDADSVTVTGRADPIKRITDLEDAVASMTNT